MIASIRITRDTTFQRHDEDARSPLPGRFIWLVAEEPDGSRLTIHFGSVIGEDDETVVLSTSAMIAELEALRSAAVRRLALASAPQQLQA